jgi:beta-glucanase (GH16 family)
MAMHLRVIGSIFIALAVIVTSAGSALAAGSRTPVGLTGRWRLAFDDEFDGRALNQAVWDPHIGWTNQNHVTDSLANLSVRGGHAIFRLASPTSGAEVETSHFSLRVGEYAEARIKFAGNGQTIYNWPAWWISGPRWPAAGENDIAEGLGQLTINYHSPLGGLETGTVAGVWARGFHTYGILRGRYFSHVYWDGRLVRTYRTHDDGQPQMLLLTMGAANVIRTGAAGQMVVDYVRAWRPA